MKLKFDLYMLNVINNNNNNNKDLHLLYILKSIVHVNNRNESMSMRAVIFP